MLHLSRGGLLSCIQSQADWGVCMRNDAESASAVEARLTAAVSGGPILVPLCPEPLCARLQEQPGGAHHERDLLFASSHSEAAWGPGTALHADPCLSI